MLEDAKAVQSAPTQPRLRCAQGLLVGAHLAVRDGEGRELGDPGEGGDDVHDANLQDETSPKRVSGSYTI